MQIRALARGPPGTVLVPPLPVGDQEHWPASAFGYSQIGCPGGAAPGAGGSGPRITPAQAQTEPLSAGPRYFNVSVWPGHDEPNDDQRELNERSGSLP